MAKVRTVEFLPEIFQTSTNKQFLAATLDQLVQEPAFTKIQGFVGRRVGPGVNPDDEYIKESTDTRTNYQLEPGVILKKHNTNVVDDAITVKVSYQQAIGARNPARLFHHAVVVDVEDDPVFYRQGLNSITIEIKHQRRNRRAGSNLRSRQGRALCGGKGSRLRSRHCRNLCRL